MKSANLLKGGPASLTRGDKLCEYAKALGIGQLTISMDPTVDLVSLIALHKTPYPQAIGGCRCLPYVCIEDAIEDVVRLAQMMSYKSAMLHFPYGGGKAVLIKPQQLPPHDLASPDPVKQSDEPIKRTDYFKSFGAVIDQLQGAYITAVDSGTTPDDMDIMASATPYVLCTTKQQKIFDISTPACTALGVLKGIEAAVHYKLGLENLTGVKVLIQGVGEVGYALAVDLSKRGADVAISDTDIQKIDHCAQAVNVTVIDPEAVYQTPCDVFAPCALGGTLNADTCLVLKTAIVAGSANNQLKTPQAGTMLHERNILYAPDFVINSGGLIQAVSAYENRSKAFLMESIDSIYHRLIEVFAACDKQQVAPSQMAERLAQQRLSQADTGHASYSS